MSWSEVKQTFLDLTRRYSEDEYFIEECWNEIETAYTSSERCYHDLAHISAMLTELDPVTEIRYRDRLLFAIFYHDLIYDPLRKDNEKRSAELFEKRISPTGFRQIREVKSLIEATKNHNFSDDPDTNLLLDLDLSILGKSPQIYRDYKNSIRKEFSIIPGFLYNPGRKKILKDFLKRDFIYKTAHFRDRYEMQARENLNTELKAL